MTTPTFTFAFDATSDSDCVPYVAKLSWNAQAKRIEQHLCTLARTPMTPTSTRVHGEFDAQPMEIVEVRLGQFKRRKRTIERRAWYLVVRQGYLVMLGDAQDTLAHDRIQRYLAGTLSLHALSQGHWVFDSATSEWPAIITPGKASTTHRRAWLTQRRAALQQELRAVDTELDLLTRPPEEGAADETEDSPGRNTADKDRRDAHAHP